MKGFWVVFFLLTVFCSACSDYSPKPYGYFRIELDEPAYTLYTDPSGVFSFNRPQISIIETEVDTVKGEWFNIAYPSLGAKIYCSYLPVESRNDLISNSEDSRRFVYKHVLKADGISEEAYSNPEKNIYALVYNVEGNVATPIHFAITDSLHYFFMGSLYFNSAVNQDSIVPVKAFIRNDIQELIGSFSWNTQPKNK